MRGATSSIESIATVALMTISDTNVPAWEAFRCTLSSASLKSYEAIGGMQVCRYSSFVVCVSNTSYEMIAISRILGNCVLLAVRISRLSVNSDEARILINTETVETTAKFCSVAFTSRITAGCGRNSRSHIDIVATPALDDVSDSSTIDAA